MITSAKLKTDDRTCVLHLCEHFGGRDSSLHGVARAFQWWLPLFDRDRYRILLCSRKGFDRATQQMINSGITPHHLGFSKLDPRNLWKLARFIRREDVDIIHAHGYGACFWARIAGLIMRVPVIVHERCNYRTVPLLQRPAELVLGRLTEHAFAVSASTRDFCTEKRYIPSRAVEVLYSGIPLDEIERMPQSWIDSTREKMGATPGEQVIGIVSRLESYKGLIDAFEAFRELLETLPRAQLWLAGDGTFESELRVWVEKHEMQDRIHFLGFRPDVRRLMQCFDVQLFPSHQEGTPNTLYEALAAGSAIVASSADGQGEILQHGSTAMLSDPGDVATMAAHLVLVLQDHALRSRLESRALNRARDFDGQVCIDRMQEKYDEIMSAAHES